MHPGKGKKGKPACPPEDRSEYAEGGMVVGKKTAMRLDRPGRKMGGRVGADCAPLSTAATTSGRL